MFLRVFSFLCFVIFITSCDKLSFTKNTQKRTLDTIIDFSSVDTFPSFIECDSLIDKKEKADCFGATIHKKIGEELKKQSVVVKDSIDEMIYVDLIIDNNGEVIFQNLESSENVRNILPDIDDLIQTAVDKLPKLFPANKRGIPVTTKYRLPIRIQLKE